MTHTRKERDAVLRNGRPTKQERLEVPKKEELTRAKKGWHTRYKNEIAILDDQLETLKDELYNEFMSFISKTSKYQDLTQQRERMQKELQRFEWKHKGGPS